jgi:hypothetical protein
MKQKQEGVMRKAWERKENKDGPDPDDVLGIVRIFYSRN